MWSCGCLGRTVLNDIINAEARNVSRATFTPEPPYLQFVDVMLICSLILFFLVLSVKGQEPLSRILIYSATAVFRHDSIPTAIDALKTHGDSIHVSFDSTEDRSLFNDDNLANYDAVLFLSNTGEVLDDSGKAALQKYLNSGGNFVAIHSASDCLRNTTFFVRELGARFDFHADLQEATVNVVGPGHPSTSDLPVAWSLRDEMYNFESDPRALGAVVVLAADESSYVDTRPRRFDQGTPHPIAWYQTRGAGVDAGGSAGRSFYTSLGHLNETWQDATFLSHVLGGISWVLQSNTTRAFNSSGLVGNRAPNVVGTSIGSSSTVRTTRTTQTPSTTATASRSSNGANNLNVSLGLMSLILLPTLSRL